MHFYNFPLLNKSRSTATCALQIMLTVTNPLANTFKPYSVSSATTQSQTAQQQQMGQPGAMSYQTSNNMPIYMQNMYGLHGYITQQQQQQQLLTVDPQQTAYSTGSDQSTTPPRSEEKGSSIVAPLGVFFGQFNR